METMQSVDKLALSCLPSAALIRLLFQDEAQPSLLMRCEEAPSIHPHRLKHRLEVAKVLLMRELQERMRMGPPLTHSSAVTDWLRLHFKDHQREAFVVLALDNQHRLLETAELFQGTLSAVHVYPREVASFALSHRASALIVAHNHPAHCPVVSEADHKLTKHLQAALCLVDVRLLDHFIVAGATVVSMAQEGLMPSLDL